ncbi:hypothetical protein GUJ93_ZPchr0009g1933 [Zizania palustris]|uniref:TITAN-like protein n=1 Tax=Zizania palustris TaxID=103762 RepID=A0A8J5RM77_ZIZPA|nr:hypothetical protein GUJ93_ZPchr0009g1933 [Zizania palustris]
MPPKRETPTPAAVFEYCELCRRNHNQGRRHRYFPAHRTALAAALSRFRSKLSDLRRALRHPSSGPRSSLWCPFCSVDLVDLDSRFACSNAIYHLTSQDHLNGVKAFLRKHGGQMDQVESYRISDDELAKWEKCCESLSTEPEMLSEGLIGPTPGLLKDIRNKSTSKNLDNFAESYIPYSSNTESCVVMPLQSPTNGAYYPNSTACHGSSTFGSIPYSPSCEIFGVPIKHCGLIPSHEQQIMLGTDLLHSVDTKMKGAQSAILGNEPNSSVSCVVHAQQKISDGNNGQGLKANVHTGAPPPWLEASEHDQENAPLRGYALPSSRKGKSGKLNPKRVGAAWAERRRAEMEMEKRGEPVPETSDSSWLPNFGSVWQSGTRKESRKEFEKNHKPHDEKSNKLPLEIKPYISKRMRVGSRASRMIFGGMPNKCNKRGVFLSKKSRPANSGMLVGAFNYYVSVHLLLLIRDGSITSRGNMEQGYVLKYNYS